MVLAAGALAGVLYQYYSPMADTATTARFTGNTHDVIQGIGPIDWLKEQYHDHRRLSALVGVMDEAVTTMNGPNVNMRAHQGDSDTALPAIAGAGQYNVRINRANPIRGFGADPDKMDSAILHELTHVAVDRGYRGSNRHQPMEFRPTNMINYAGGGAAREAQALAAQHDAILQTFTGDDLIPPTERVYINSRLGRMANSTTEFDTVANELLLYFHLKGIPARSETSKMLTATTKARQVLRRT